MSRETDYSSIGIDFFNRRPNRLTNDGVEEFIDALRKDLENGIGFVPFVGAGFSAPSGAPLIWDLETYLRRCICLALRPGSPDYQPWQPRLHRWPAFIESNGKNASDWLAVLEAEYTRRKTKPNDKELRIFQEAVGAMADWRSSLVFLSRLVRDNEGTAYLDAPRQEVVDACLRAAMSGKQPSLGHKMLASLGGVLRLDLILTTNFDDLLERAFADARNPLQIHTVQQGSPLPNRDAISQARSLVKLHGTNFGLRADYTLDATPTEADLNSFVEYFANNSATLDRDRGTSTSGGTFGRKVLMLGFSGTDRRIQEFIKHAWRRYGDGFEVYWVCYSSQDVANITDFVRRYSESRPRDHSSSPPPPALGPRRCRLLQHKQLGLLLLQIYQTLRQTLPASDCPFPSISRLPFPPLDRDLCPKETSDSGYTPHPSDGVCGGQQMESGAETSLLVDPRMGSDMRSPVNCKSGARRKGDKSNRECAPGIGGEAPLQRGADELVAKLRDMFNEGYKQHRLTVVQAPGEVVGLTSLYAPAFGALQDAYTCLWIDMNDVTSADSLFETLLDAVHYRLGIENWTPLRDDADARRRSEEMQRIARLSGKPWILFLNARETPGVNGVASDAEDQPNGWIDAENAPTYSSDKSSDCRSFVQLLKALTAYSGSESGPEGTIAIVLLIRGHSNKDTKPKILDMLLSSRVIDERAVITPTEFEPQVTYDERQVIECARVNQNDWSEEKLSLLQSLVSMQRPRLLATVAFLSSTSGDVTKQQREMIGSLLSTGFLRHKPGGFPSVVTSNPANGGHPKTGQRAAR